MPEQLTTEVDPLEWRCLTPTLWVGVGPRGVAGCVEVGRRYVLTDGEGRVFGRFRRLGDAQAMLELLCAQRAGRGIRREGARSPVGMRAG